MRRRSLTRTERLPFYRKLDQLLLVPVLAITVIGLIVLNQILAARLPATYPRNIIVQSGSVVIGIILLLLTVQAGKAFIRNLGRIMYVMALVLQCLLPFLGDRSIAAETGANSWLKLPVIGTIQPSEFSKIGLAILVAFVLQKMDDKEWSYWQGFSTIAVLTLPHLVLIMLYQKDFGTTLVLLFMLMTMIFVWGIKMRYVVLTLSLVVTAFPLVWHFYLADYQKRRLLTFLYPGIDTQASYNVEQAKKAIAMGGLTGNRSGEFVQVPVQESDFIFTAIAERMGLVGAAALIILIFIYLRRGIYVAAHATTAAERYMCTGIISFFAFHSIENIGMCMGLLPVTGIPLPFVSQGGSAMVANFLALGVLLATSAHIRER